MKRILYLLYYFRKLDWQKLNKFVQHVSAETGRSKPAIWQDMILSSLRYNISLLEYFNFHFYKLPDEDKATFAGTGYMYEYQLAMNPRESRNSLHDKLIFLDQYKPFVRHAFVTLEALEKNPHLADPLLHANSEKVVLKSSDGQCGRGIEVWNSKELNPEKLVRQLREGGNDFVEAFVTQHAELMRLSPSGLNTIRVITQLDQRDKVHFLGARLRITVNSSVDNLAAGNIAAPIDLESGKVTGPGVYSDITRQDEHIHPVTGVEIEGFQVPFWEETLEMCQQAALLDPRNRSIGWDVAITDEGPELIEGNHDWCKLLWQLPVKKGLKPVLEAYLREFKS